MAIDLGKIERKIKKKNYKNPLEFRDDMRLIWNNCRIYNSLGNVVRIAGDLLSQYFERRWECSGIEEYLAKRLSLEHMREDCLVPIEELIIQTKQTEISITSSKKCCRGSIGKHGPMHCLSFEAKRKPALALGNLSSDKQTTVFEIIQRDLKLTQIALKFTSDEIEIDIDMLEPKILNRLNHFINENQKGTKTGRQMKTQSFGYKIPLNLSPVSNQLIVLNQKSSKSNFEIKNE